MAEAPKHPGARGEAGAGRDDVVHQQHRTTWIPSPSTPECRLQPIRHRQLDLIGDLTTGPTIGADLRRSPSPRQPVPPSSPQRRRHFDREESRMVDATVTTSEPVTRHRHDEGCPRRSVDGCAPVDPPRVRSDLEPQPSAQPTPRITIGAVLRGGEHLHDLRCVVDQHREFVDPLGRGRCRAARAGHRRGERLVPPGLARRGPAEPRIAHGGQTGPCRLHTPPQRCCRIHPSRRSPPGDPTRLQPFDHVPHAPVRPPGSFVRSLRDRSPDSGSAGEIHGDSAMDLAATRERGNAPIRTSGPRRMRGPDDRTDSKFGGRRPDQAPAIFRSTVGRMPPFR